MNIKQDVVFVVLHYMVIKDTLDCIESIKKHIDTPYYKIVIVDNASPNKSGNDLAELFNKDEKVFVICNTENLGFAGGNNVGINYALQNFVFQFIILLNNDTLLIQSDMFQKISKEYAKSHFALLGPMIMTADGKCDCTPISEEPITREMILRMLMKEKLRYYFSKLYMPNPYNIFMRIKKRIKRTKVIKKHKDYIHRREDIRIHGCFMIFSNVYFKVFNGLDEATFLYHEEEILYLHLYNNNLKSVYLPEIQIFHKEDMATNAIVSKKNKVKRFIFKHSLDSCKELLRIYDEYNIGNGN